MTDTIIKVCFPFAGDVVGGSHISVLGLIRNLDSRRFAPIILPQYFDGEIARLFREAGLPVERGPRTPKLDYTGPVRIGQFARLVLGYARLARFLRSRGIDVVHTNDGPTHATWALPARLAGAKLLWHHRGDPGAKGLRLAAPLLAHRVVTVSEFSLPRPGWYSAARKASVVHSPFATDIREDRTSARRALLGELGCPPETRFVGYFGALLDRKRPQLFVDSIAELVARMPGTPMMGLIFGEAHTGDNDTAVGKRAAMLGVAERIRLMGYRTPGMRWLAACDLLVVPAVDEPFGRTLIEAMIVGTPVIATASGGNPEALRDGKIGVLVPPEDAEALAVAAKGLLSDPRRYADLADKARADALARFGEKRHAHAIMHMYEEMLARRTERSRPAGRLGARSQGGRMRTRHG